MNTDSIRTTELESDNYASMAINVNGTSVGVVEIAVLNREDDYSATSIPCILIQAN